MQLFTSHVSLFIRTQTRRSSTLFVLYIAKQVQVGCAECFRRLAAFKRVTNVRNKVLQIILLRRDSSRTLFFAIFTTAKNLNIYPFMNQLNYVYTVYERNA